MAGRMRHREGTLRPFALSEILASACDELLELSRSADELQATIGAIVGALPRPLEPSAQIRLQAADALSQRLTRLAELVAALRAEVSDDWVLDPDPAATSELLRAIARLAEARGKASRQTPDDGDECEFF
jgi:hypothetical protein